jgi:hypothetical protein
MVCAFDELIPYPRTPTAFQKGAEFILCLRINAKLFLLRNKIAVIEAGDMLNC